MDQRGWHLCDVCMALLLLQLQCPLRCGAACSVLHACPWMRPWNGELCSGGTRLQSLPLDTYLSLRESKAIRLHTHLVGD
jgi:hypothetical protein